MELNSRNLHSSEASRHEYIIVNVIVFEKKQKKKHKIKELSL